MNFKIGDRVRCSEPVDGNLNVVGRTGIVKIVDDEMIGVDFQQYVAGHTLAGGELGEEHAAPGEGWWCYPESLRKVNMCFTNK